MSKTRTVVPKGLMYCPYCQGAIFIVTRKAVYDENKGWPTKHLKHINGDKVFPRDIEYCRDCHSDLNAYHLFYSNSNEEKVMTKKTLNWPVILTAISLILFAVLCFRAAFAATITTGGKSGTYIKVGYKLSEMLPGEDQVLTSKGSKENLDRIMKGEADIGIVQMDALAWYISKYPEAEHKVELMGPLYDECVYLAVNKRGRVRTEDDLQKEGVTVAIGKQGSGTAITWDYMRQLEPGYKKAAVKYTGGTRALGKMAAKPDGEIDAVLWVTKPTLNGKYAQSVLKNDDLKFLDLNDKDLNDKYKPTGKPIYEFCTVKSSEGFFGGKVKTICVGAVVVANTDADEDMLESLSDIMLNYRNSILPQK